MSAGDNLRVNQVDLKDASPAREGVSAGRVNQGGDRMSTLEESMPQRTIRRDPKKHAWVLVDGAAHTRSLPWSDEAPAISVVLWLKTQMNGRVSVTVEV